MSLAASGNDQPAQGADASDTLTYELNWASTFSRTVPYAWARAGDLYSLVSFGNVIKINGGELPSVGLRVKMGTCYRRCKVQSRPAHTCDQDFLPMRDANDVKDVGNLCPRTIADETDEIL